jgi:tetratricopeptide (TPR) repeat protein
MLLQSAEESFRKGLKSLETGRNREAMAFFEAAIELERRRKDGPPQARYLSLYGYCLGTVGNKRHEGIRFCREATELEQYNADLHCNLGRVLLAAGRRKDAYQAFVRGLRIQTDHQEIIRSLKHMGIRRRPVVPFLARGNPINVFLGRLRSR